MKLAWPAAVAAAGVLLLLASWGLPPPGPAEIERRLFAHPEMAPYNRSNSTIARIAPEDLAKLAAEQPAIYGGLTASASLYRAEFSRPGGRVLVIYDAGSDRILRVFNLLQGRLG